MKLGLTFTHKSSDYVLALRMLDPTLELVMLDGVGPRNVVSGLDGLVLTGGHDIDPVMYKATRHPHCGESWQERDLAEASYTRIALSCKIPILGICRGHQFLNVMFGGTLHQHISGHAQSWVRAHTINAGNDSSASVNSRHHQGIRRLGEGLSVVATAPDGLVESIAHKSLPVWGVQWHPETLTLANLSPQVSTHLFQYFLKECR